MNPFLQKIVSRIPFFRKKLVARAPITRQLDKYELAEVIAWRGQARKMKFFYSDVP